MLIILLHVNSVTLLFFWHNHCVIALGQSLELNYSGHATKKIKEQELVPLIGAGVSMSLTDSAGKPFFPSWSSLLVRAADKLKAENKDEEVLVRQLVKMGKLQDAANYAKAGLSGSLWYDFLKTQFTLNYANLDPHGKELPKAIWQLSSQLITLNYDKVMQWGSEQSANITVVDNSNEGALADFAKATDATPLIWHLHGHIDEPAQIILTPEGYTRLYSATGQQQSGNAHFPQALQILQSTLVTKSLALFHYTVVTCKPRPKFAENHTLHYFL